MAVLAGARAAIPADVALTRVRLRTHHAAATPRSGFAGRTAALARLAASASRSRASAVGASLDRPVLRHEATGPQSAPDARRGACACVPAELACIPSGFASRSSRRCAPARPHRRECRPVLANAMSRKRGAPAAVPCCARAPCSRLQSLPNPFSPGFRTAGRRAPAERFPFAVPSRTPRACGNRNREPRRDRARFALRPTPRFSRPPFRSRQAPRSLALAPGSSPRRRAGARPPSATLLIDPSSRTKRPVRNPKARCQRQCRRSCGAACIQSPSPRDRAALRCRCRYPLPLPSCPRDSGR